MRTFCCKECDTCFETEETEDLECPCGSIRVVEVEED